MDEHSNIILTKIRVLREWRKLTQTDLAERLGVDLKTYNNWETGKTDLTIQRISRIAEILDVDAKLIWDPKQFEDKNWEMSNGARFALGKMTLSKSTSNEVNILERLVTQLEINQKKDTEIIDQLKRRVAELEQQLDQVKKK